MSDLCHHGDDRPWQDEFDLIRTLLDTSKKVLNLSGTVREPAGDDACLLASLARPIITTDTQKENVHFKTAWQRPEEIGKKAVAITLSDLAASYARPVALFVNLSLPPTLSVRYVEALYRGIADELAHYRCSLGGGNVSRGSELSLDLFAIGEGREDVFPKRSAAQPGFGVYVTGPLGRSRGGLEALKSGDKNFSSLVDCFKFPRARFDAAAVLARHGVSCLMDISDGLSGDAKHMAKASHVTISLNLEGIGVDKDLSVFCGKHGLNPLEMALAGGEDYELLFACIPETFNRIYKVLPAVYQVGVCTPFQQQHVMHPAITLSSFQHGQ